ncbi:MAG: GNAT family N-acetyltransferase, partial [Actinomycetes bacterium]
MQVELIDDPAEFLRRSVTLRAAEPVLTNVVGTVAQSAVDGRAFEDCWWWLVSDDAGEPVACAMRTAPWNLALGPTSEAAAAALGRAVAAADPQLPGVVGPVAAVQSLISALPGHPATRVTMNDVVHVLDELVDPPQVPGELVVADRSQLDRLVEWHVEFARDAGLVQRDPRPSVLQRLEQHGLFWWCVDGEPVSMAGHTPPLSAPSGTVGRIGPVFTPARFRRRGYAAALTGAVVRPLQPASSVVKHLADAAKATHNRVYHPLG